MFCLTGTNIINSLRQRIPKRSSTSFHVHFEVVAMFNSIPLVPSFSVCAKNAGSTGFPRTSWAWVVACLPSGFSGRSMKRQSHLIAVVSQFKKKKKCTKISKICTRRRFKNKTLRRRAVAANHVDLSLLHYIKWSHSTEKPLKWIAQWLNHSFIIYRRLFS